jgi:ADP-ribose pyrophosphatase
VKSWRKLEEQVVFDSRRRIARRRFELPGGSVEDFEVKSEPDVVAVLALTPEESVVLARQFRVGPEEVLVELPGGVIEAAESPLDAARRELFEETGYTGELRRAGELVDCAYSTRTKHAFVATGCRAVSEPQPHEGEAVEVVLLSLPEFREHLRSGRLTDVDVAYAGLDALGLLG